MGIDKKFFLLVVLLILAYIYQSIFISPITSAGDLPYYWSTHIKELGLPYLWNPHWQTGLGGTQSIILPLKFYLQLPILLFVNPLNIPWEVVQRIIFFFVFFALSIFSSYRLSKSWIGSLIYASNTWILMVFSGGQIGIALAYSLAPLVLLQFIKTIDESFLKSLQKQRLLISAFAAGILLSLLIMFDIRVTYIILLAIGIYLLLFIISQPFKELKKRYKFLVLYVCIIPGIVTLLLNMYWILPLLFSGSSLSGEALQPDLEQVKFFSFATFSNTLGLLHPNWPENIFGKVGFMKPEFLLLPIIAFSSLLFLNKKTQKSDQTKVLVFALIGLIGVFLAKGASEPFGNIYLWLFENVPGFNMFRDSTKFYILIALAYSFLIPFAINQFANVIKTKWKVKKNVAFMLMACFVLYFLFLIRPAVLGQVGGIFKMHQIPQEYVQLKDYLENDKQFARTLWIPQYQRFGYFSNQDPVLSGADMFIGVQQKNIVKELKKPAAIKQLQSMSVKYIILPYDSEGEIFLNDRKYDEKVYQKFYKDLKTVQGLKEQKHFGKIVVFEVSNAKDHVWMQNAKDSKSIVSYKRVNDTKFDIEIKNNKKGDRLIFSEHFDIGWVLQYGSTEIKSAPYNKVLNSYILPDTVSSAALVYKPQQYLTYGWWISGATLVLLIGIIVLKKKKR